MATGMNLGTLVVKLSADVVELKGGLAAAEAQMRKTNTKLDGFVKDAKGHFGKLANAAGMVDNFGKTLDKLFAPDMTGNAKIWGEEVARALGTTRQGMAAFGERLNILGDALKTLSFASALAPAVPLMASILAATLGVVGAIGALSEALENLKETAKQDTDSGSFLEKGSMFMGRQYNKVFKAVGSDLRMPETLEEVRDYNAGFISEAKTLAKKTSDTLSKSVTKGIEKVSQTIGVDLQKVLDALGEAFSGKSKSWAEYGEKIRKALDKALEDMVKEGLDAMRTALQEKSQLEATLVQEGRDAFTEALRKRAEERKKAENRAKLMESRKTERMEAAAGAVGGMGPIGAVVAGGMSGGPYGAGLAAIGQIVGAAQNLQKAFAPAVVLFGRFGDLLTPVVNSLIPALNVAVVLVDALAPAFKLLGDFAGTIVVAALVSLMPYLTVFATTLDMAQPAIEGLAWVFRKVTEGMVWTWNKLMDALDAILPDIISDAPQKMKIKLDLDQRLIEQKERELKTITQLNQQLTNLPEGFKYNARRFGAADAKSSWREAMGVVGGGTGVVQVNNFYTTRPNEVADAVQRRMDTANRATTGVAAGGFDRRYTTAKVQ